MGQTVYSIRINCESIFIRDTGDGSSAGDVYFVAEVGGQRHGRSSTTSLKPNSTLDLKGAGYSWELRIVDPTTPIALKVDCWDHDALSPDDALCSLSPNIGPPWKPTTDKRTASGGNFDLSFTVDVTAIEVTKTTIAMVSRQASGSTYRSTLRAPAGAVARLTEVWKRRTRERSGDSVSTFTSMPAVWPSSAPPMIFTFTSAS